MVEVVGHTYLDLPMCRLCLLDMSNLTRSKGDVRTCFHTVFERHINYGIFTNSLLAKSEMMNGFNEQGRCLFNAQTKIRYEVYALHTHTHVTYTLMRSRFELALLKLHIQHDTSHWNVAACMWVACTVAQHRAMFVFKLTASFHAGYGAKPDSSCPALRFL